MKNIKVLAATLLFILSADYFAQDKNFGAGIMLGEPAGFSGKYWLNETESINFGIGAALFKTNKSFSLHVDLIQNLCGLFESPYTNQFYYGFGLRLHMNSKNRGGVGVRGVGGLSMFLDKLPVDLFAELAPVFTLLPDTSLEFDLSLGGRYYFDKFPIEF
ncbi:MAG: hypothetical protein KJ799_18050 [Bacteroidetes bacterium]|nr:hypothetical protein [Bacteroidota bacterium]MBU1677515.1 hypothetical protein [Bacteroidota bacterium]MBU2508602.1 hypothetical protein [Bacteroidota bacterium]